jgi:hypothetical protein
MASPSCLPKSDDVFGPIVQGCRSNFDFTLLFEQTILSIGPAALLLIFAPPRVLRLLRSTKKTLSSRLRLYKTVLTFRSPRGHQLTVLVRLHRFSRRPVGLVDLLVQEPAHPGSFAFRNPLIPCRHRTPLLVSPRTQSGNPAIIVTQHLPPGVSLV